MRIKVTHEESEAEEGDDAGDDAGKDRRAAERRALMHQFRASRTVAPRMIGVAIRKREPRRRLMAEAGDDAGAMVKPEREKPGIRAKHCATPTANAPFQLSSSSEAAALPAIWSEK